MAIERLVGSDALLQKVTFGTLLETGSPAAKTWYKIEVKTGDTVFPAGFGVGDFIQGEMCEASATFSATNSVKEATFDTVLDARSFTVELSKDEIDVTVLADGNKKYRAGKQDFSGTVEGITILSEAKKANSIMNRFFRTVTGTNNQGTGTTVLNPLSTGDYYIRGLLQKDDTVGETEVFFFAQIELFGYSLGASMDGAQEWSSGLRLVGADPLIYFVESVKAST